MQPRPALDVALTQKGEGVDARCAGHTSCEAGRPCSRVSIRLAARQMARAAAQPTMEVRPVVEQFSMSTTTPYQPETSPVIQSFGALVPVRLGLADDVRHRSIAALNRLLAHTTALRDLYKKAHWQTSGANFYELHLLFDKHSNEQEAMMDVLAERVQTLGGVARALVKDIAQETRLSRAPSGIESSPNQLARLVDGHEFILVEARPLAREAAASGDEGTNDVIVSQIVRGNELQSWFVHRHLAALKNVD